MEKIMRTRKEACKMIVVAEEPCGNKAIARAYRKELREVSKKKM